jgi:hypothetical protein
MFDFSNEQCRTLAEKAVAAGKPEEAMRWYNTAAANTIGHKKTDSYLKLCAEVAENFKVGIIHQYATYEMYIQEIHHIMKVNAAKLTAYRDSRIYGSRFMVSPEEESTICNLIYYASKLQEKP